MDRTVNARELFRGERSLAPRVSTVIAWEVRAPDNIGAIVRLAANFGCDRVLLVEPSDTPHNHRRIRKTAVGAPDHVDWGFVTADELAAQRGALPPIVALETSIESVDLREVAWPPECALLIGSESYGLPEEALALCKHAVHIPTTGPLKSLNVSHALAIALYEASARTTR